MRNDLTPFRTVRELLANRDEVLMSNAVGVDGQLYEDSVENLTAILAMEQDYKDMLAALHDADEFCQQGLNSPYAEHWEAALHDIMELVRNAITKAKGAAA